MVTCRCDVVVRGVTFGPLKRLAGGQTEAAEAAAEEEEEGATPSIGDAESTTFHITRLLLLSNTTRAHTPDHGPPSTGATITR